MNLRRLALCFAVGAFVGTALDRIHTFTGVLRYAGPTAWGEAWWIPLVMGAAAIGLVGTHAVLRKAFHEVADGSAHEVAVASAWFACVYLASGMAKDNPRALTLLFVATFMARALRTPTSRAMWAHALVACVAGVLAEIALTRAGAMTFLHPNVAGVPFWIGGIYLHAALLGRAIDRSGTV